MRLFEVDNLVEEVKEKCSDIYNSYLQENNYLYHGSRNLDTRINKISNPTNRKPKSTPKLIQNLVDEHLKNEGFQALRSNRRSFDEFLEPNSSNLKEVLNSDKPYEVMIKGNVYMVPSINLYDFFPEFS